MLAITATIVLILGALCVPLPIQTGTCDNRIHKFTTKPPSDKREQLHFYTRQIPLEWMYSITSME